MLATALWLSVAAGASDTNKKRPSGLKLPPGKLRSGYSRHLGHEIEPGHPYWGQQHYQAKEESPDEYDDPYYKPEKETKAPKGEKKEKKSSKSSKTKKGDSSSDHDPWYPDDPHPWYPPPVRNQQSKSQRIITIQAKMSQHVLLITTLHPLRISPLVL